MASRACRVSVRGTRVRVRVRVRGIRVRRISVRGIRVRGIRVRGMDVEGSSLVACLQVVETLHELPPLAFLFGLFGPLAVEEVHDEAAIEIALLPGR